MGYRVSVDLGLCNSSLLCIRVAPTVFRTDDDGVTRVIDATPGPAMRPLVEEALQRCPRQAISIVRTDE